MGLLEKCLNEIRIAGLFDKNSIGNGKIGQSLEDLIRLFCKQNHSGQDAEIVSSIFKDLIDGKNISKIGKYSFSKKE